MTSHFNIYGWLIVLYAVRRRLSIAQAKMDRIRQNQKIPKKKKGKRNRKTLLKYCKHIYVAELVNFMEMEKLKKVYARRKKKRRDKKTQYYVSKGPVQDLLQF